ncbi:MAG: hypothetical protein PVI63_09940 [Anaerolineae bacterium]
MKRNLNDRLAGLGGQLLGLGRPDKVPLEETLDLRQRDEIWECTARKGRVWITPPDCAPYRPYVVLTVSREDRILGLEVVEDDPTPPEVINALAKAMRYPAPGSGGKRRPTVIHLDDALLTEALAPELGKVGIACKFRHSLRVAERALQEMWGYIGEERTIPGLLEVPGVTPFMVNGLFEAAASFYHAAPWRTVSDSDPIEIRYPVDSQPRYAAVMGHGGQTYGLAIYSSRDVLRETYAGTPPDQVIEKGNWTSLLYDEAVETPIDDLDAIEAHGWPVADKYAYPLPLQMGPAGRLTRPGKSDLLRMEAALLAIPRFVRDHVKAAAGRLRAAEETLTITMADGEDRIHLRYPVPGLEMVSEDDEAFIADVVGVLERNLELLDCFEEWLRNKGLSARTIRTHIDNVERFVELYLINEGGSIGVPCSADEAAPADVDEFLAEWLPSGTERGLVATVTSHIASLKKFTICLREMGQMGAEESNEILALLREDRGYYIELARYLEEGPFGG